MSGLEALQESIDPLQITFAFCSCLGIQEQVCHQGEEDGGAVTLDSGHEEGEEADEVQQIHGCALNNVFHHAPLVIYE